MHILLISYTFPPSSGIGGRRWAKFTKYLCILGYNVHVIYAKNKLNSKSLWEEDVVHDKRIKRYGLESRYPIILNSQPDTFSKKIEYKYALLKVKSQSKGSPYDKGIFWKKSMLELSKELIKRHEIKNVIVSCAPFSSSYYAIELKNHFKNLNLLVDLRDPWTWGKAYGFSTLNKKRLEFEKTMEQMVVEKADRIFVPSLEMKNHLDLVYTKFISKFSVLSHAYDENEIHQKTKVKSEKIRLLFYGTLYGNLDEVFRKLALIISTSEISICLDIYSSTRNYINYFSDKNVIGSNVNYFSEMETRNLFENIDKYDYVLIVQPYYAKDFITTKIYEIIYSKTPIFLISKKGKLSEFIIENKLGMFLEPDFDQVNFNNVINKHESKYEIDNFPIQEYSFNKITSELISHFKK